MIRKKDYQRESHRSSSEQGRFITTNQTTSINTEDISIPHEEDICWLRYCSLLRKAPCGCREDKEPRDVLWAKEMGNRNKLCIKNLNARK